MSTGRRPEKLGYQQSTVCRLVVGIRHYQAIAPTERSDRILRRSATCVKGLKYPGASPWTTGQYGDLELDSLKNAQSLEASQRVVDVVG